MFSVAQTPTFRAEVPVPVLDGEGKEKTFKFTAIFARLDADELKKLAEEINAGGLTHRAFCDRVLRGWEGVTAEEGAPLVYNGDEAVDRLLKVFPVGRCLVNTFLEKVGGARLGN